MNYFLGLAPDTWVLILIIVGIVALNLIVTGKRIKEIEGEDAND